jgi:hypothetical protein
MTNLDGTSAPAPHSPGRLPKASPDALDDDHVALPMSARRWTVRDSWDDIVPDTWGADRLLDELLTRADWYIAHHTNEEGRPLTRRQGLGYAMASIADDLRQIAGATGVHHTAPKYLAGPSYELRRYDL